MKKKCTNGKCRKIFTIRDKEQAVCPYCGKEYPRLIKGLNGEERHMLASQKVKSASGRYKVVISGYEEGQKGEAVRVVHKSTGLPILNAKDAVENLRHAGIFVDGDLSLLEAVLLKSDIDHGINDKHICQVDIIPM